MKRLLHIIFIAILWPSFCWGVEPPLKLRESLSFTLEYGPPIGAFASAGSPAVLLLERGGAYSLLDASSHAIHHLAKSDSSGPDGIVYGAYWDNDKPMLFYYDKQVAKRFDPKNPTSPEIISAENHNLSLSTSVWSSDAGVLIDAVNPYLLEGGKLVAGHETKIRTHHVPWQSGLVLLSDSRYVTSGYEDQALRIWSLPEGELMQEWTLGKWYSSRKIYHIAVVQGRLLVASAGGRIEERSLQSGEVLWSTRPCRGGAASFHYSSHYRNLGSEFSRPTHSINTQGDIHYICGKKIGTIWRSENAWHHQALDELSGLPGNVINMEVLSGTHLIVIVGEDGSVHVVDRKQQRVVQTLKSVARGNVNAVTYIPAIKQLLVIGVEGAIHFYDLKSGESPLLP